MDTVEELKEQIRHLRECIKYINSYIIIVEEVAGFAYKYIVRNGDADIYLGDKVGGVHLIKIEAYGKSIDVLGCGMTAAITLDGLPHSVRQIHKDEK